MSQFANRRSFSQHTLLTARDGHDGRFVQSNALSRKTDLSGRSPQIDCQIGGEIVSKPAEHPCSIFLCGHRGQSSRSPETLLRKLAAVAVNLRIARVLPANRQSPQYPSPRRQILQFCLVFRRFHA
jgi:hypothetical protein